MTQYQYLCHERPPMPGAIPMQGLVSIKNPPEGVDVVTINGITYNCWGYVIYSRPLSDKELADYELLYVSTIRTFP